MATDRFVSAGVFTRENDLTFLPQGIAEIGAAFIGGTSQGPAFVPTIVQSADEFRKIFGDASTEYYLGHAVINYMKDAARGTIVRVLGIAGYDEQESKPVLLSIASAGGEYPLAVIFPARNTETVTALSIESASLTDADGSAASGTTNFNLNLQANNGLTSSFTGLSLDSGSSAYFVNALGSGQAAASVGYISHHWPRAIEALPAGAATSGAYVTVRSGSTVADILNFSGSTYGPYDGAETPWIQSQTVGGKRHDLFKVHTIADGNASNKIIKISIASTRPATSTAIDQHGLFSLIVRSYDDTDSKLSVLEQFDNVSIDPDSPNYIARRIGDQYWNVNTTTTEATLEGEWANNSTWIYVEMASGIENVPDTALPAGFGQLYSPVNFGAVGLSIPAQATGTFTTTRYATPTGASESIENTKTYYGWNFVDDTNKVYINPLPSGSSAIGTAFSLENLTGNDLTVAAAVVSGTIANSNLRKFTVPLQKGFDGLNPSRVFAKAADITAGNTQGYDLTVSTSSGAKAFKLALDIVGNPEAFDINLLIMPGVLRQLHSYVTQVGIDMCEARADCFYIMDGFQFNQTVAAVTNVVAAVDTSYAAVYHPWIKIFDAVSNKNMWVPPSAVMAGVFAFNDKVAAEWFAPAGLNRGGITEAIQVEKRLTKANRDDLYDGRVNPIALFPAQGIVAFGQKTLQVKPSALDRINVRRLLIAVKKFLASSANFLVFEQNVDATRQRFLNIANPYLASIQERSGLYAFKVIMDSSNNTPDLIDRNILVGQIYLQPTRTAEFISLEFNITPTGLVMPE